MQFGIFYSNKMKKFIEENADNYDLIFFYQFETFLFIYLFLNKYKTQLIK